MNKHVDIAVVAADDESDHWNLENVVGRLRIARDRWRQGYARKREFVRSSFPSRDVIETIIADIVGALFPMRLGPPDLRESSEDYFVGHTLTVALDSLYRQVRLELAIAQPETSDEALDDRAREIVHQFADSIPDIREILDTDVEAAFVGDPAALSIDEVLLCYPGVRAIIHYRLAHGLFRLGARLVARIIADIAHSATGIDIHPGAQIGRSFFIDHGTGVVIGETAVIGDRVRLYQAVTLGAKRFPRGEDGVLAKGLPRHPIVEDDVVIYAGATILGRIVIGRGSTIGGNVWLTESVPAESLVAQAQMTNQDPCRSFTDCS